MLRSRFNPKIDTNFQNGHGYKSVIGKFIINTNMNDITNTSEFMKCSEYVQRIYNNGGIRLSTVGYLNGGVKKSAEELQEDNLLLSQAMRQVYKIFIKMFTRYGKQVSFRPFVYQPYAPNTVYNRFKCVEKSVSYDVQGYIQLNKRSKRLKNVMNRNTRLVNSVKKISASLALFFSFTDTLQLSTELTQ